MSNIVTKYRKGRFDSKGMVEFHLRPYSDEPVDYDSYEDCVNSLGDWTYDWVIFTVVSRIGKKDD